MIGLFKLNVSILKNISKILITLLDANQSERFSYRLLKHIKSIIKESEEAIGCSDQLEAFYSLLEMFASRKKHEYSYDNSDEDARNDEEKEKLRRVIEYVSCSSEKLNINEHLDAPQHDENNNKTNFANFMDDSSLHGSDEDVQNNFYKELLNMFMRADKYHIPNTSVNVANEWHETK